MHCLAKEDTAVKNGKDYVHSSLFTYTTWLEKKRMIVDATQKPRSEALPINRGDLSRFIN